MTRARRVTIWAMIPAIALLCCALAEWFEWQGPVGFWLREAGIVGGAVSATLALIFAVEALRAFKAMVHFQRSLEIAMRLRPRTAPAQPQTESPETEPSEPDVKSVRRLPAHEEQRRLQRVRRLEREVELLAAMRDLSLIANDDTDFQGIVEPALDLLQQLFEATEIQLFLCKEKATDGLHLAALRRKKSTVWGTLSAPMRSKGARPQALKALTERRAFTRYKGRRLNALAVLWADQQPVGVISVFIPRRGRDDSWAAEVLGELTHITKHIALVINKPKLYDRAVLDALTGLYSKRHYLDQVPKSMSASRRLGHALALIVVDIDKFKTINDTHGHVSGDIVLAAVSGIIRQSIRDYDAAYRYGGEEICIVGPNLEIDQAYALAERIRRAIEKAEIHGDKGQLIPVTASFGVTAWSADMEKLGDFMAAADQWLYKAKAEGRNQVRPRPSELKATARSKMRSADQRTQSELLKRRKNAGLRCEGASRVQRKRGHKTRRQNPSASEV